MSKVNPLPSYLFILEIVDVDNKKKKILSIRTHARRQKLLIKSRINAYTKTTAVTKKIILENWNNTIQIIQEKVQKLVSKVVLSKIQIFLLGTIQ